MDAGLSCETGVPCRCSMPSGCFLSVLFGYVVGLSAVPPFLFHPSRLPPTSFFPSGQRATHAIVLFLRLFRVMSAFGGVGDSYSSRGWACSVEPRRILGEARFSFPLRFDVVSAFSSASWSLSSLRRLYIRDSFADDCSKAITLEIEGVVRRKLYSLYPCFPSPGFLELF